MKISGFLNINKPQGITSFGVIRKVRKIFKVKKIGHAGNLDPDATGVLVLGIGYATRFLPFILDLPKEYFALIKLGVLTDTLDSSGEVIDKKPVPPLTKERIEEVLKNFVGEIYQIPPFYSAIRKEGKRLYELAREGILVHVNPKKVTIYKINLIDFGEDFIRIRVYASKGTYIRSLARDIGQKLGTYGIVSGLVRTKIGHFTIDESVEISDNLINHIIPTDEGMKHMPKVFVDSIGIKHIRHGNKAPSFSIIKKEGYIKSFQLVRIYDDKNNFIGVGIMKFDSVYPKRLMPF